MYFKFTTKQQSIDFCKLVNNGENISVNETNVTTGYAQPIEILGAFYVIADDVTSKYTDAEAIDIYAEIYNDPTPPTLLSYAVEIPLEYRLPFRNGVFKLNAFEVPLDDYQDTKVVNLAYFEWAEFRAELDTKDANGNFVYQALKDSLMDLWDYVELQVINQNLIIL
jgi:hypothetical protein